MRCVRSVPAATQEAMRTRHLTEPASIVVNSLRLVDQPADLAREDISGAPPDELVELAWELADAEPTSALRLVCGDGKKLVAVSTKHKCVRPVSQWDGSGRCLAVYVGLLDGAEDA